MKEISIGEFARRSRLSLKALRLYDERGVLVPARVDQASGYRYYDTAQLDQARLVVMLRQLQLPLAAVKELLACDPADAAKRMYEVATREMPVRSLLCLKRNVDEQGQWAFGKEFIAILRERRLPRIEGRAGAFFCIYWGLVSGDSDGPIEWCRPVPQAEARALAERYPDLTLRTEPAHREAFVALPAGPGGFSAAGFQLAAESLQAWGQEQEQEHEDERLTLTPEDLGLRTTYLATGAVTKTSVPDDYCDLALPFA